MGENALGRSMFILPKTRDVCKYKERLPSCIKDDDGEGRFEIGLGFLGSRGKKIELEKYQEVEEFRRNFTGRSFCTMQFFLHISSTGN
ncbi:hypothetical protein CEXT_740321 [Caerostris extrusa]|uniref:Uncharacterized protein n=1 Tax=Caerostris extrusa TaxID=172846 RepID=A0AAV4SU47_CAEEX|nr:hypothetical protein CEXT_740321 [Caerostris extrusa]